MNLWSNSCYVCFTAVENFLWPYFSITVFYLGGEEMLFNSLTFIIFLAVVLGLYYTLPQKLKWIMLLIASCIFYMGWRAELIILIVISTLSNWLLARLIYDKPEKKKVFLIISLIINFGLLFVFNYMHNSTNEGRCQDLMVFYVL